MNDDFIFIETPDDSDLPLIDSMTYTRLIKEWDAVIIELDSAQNILNNEVWKNIFNIYSSLIFHDKDHCYEFIENCLIDLDQRIFKFLKNELYNLLNLFIDILNLFNMPLNILKKINILNFLNILPTLSDKYNFLILKLLEISLEPLSLDDIYDFNNNNYPFLNFLLKSFDSSTNLSLNIRKLIDEMIKTSRESLKIFLPLFFKKISTLFVLFSQISPSIYHNSLPNIIIHWISYSILTIHEPVIINLFLNYIENNLLIPLRNYSDYNQFKTIYFFLSELQHNPTLTLFIKEIINPNNYFALKCEKWSIKWTFEFLKLISIFLDTRCQALRDGFFYNLNVDLMNHLYSFPNLPLTSSLSNEELKIDESLQKADLYSLYSTINHELPLYSPHIFTFLPFLLSIYESFWSLPIEIAELLTSIFEKIASTNSFQSYSFCFLQGYNLYSKTSLLLKDFDKIDKNLQRIMRNFLIIMNKILKQFPKPSK